ncbi:MAG: hypothetical protein QM499_08920 [Flavobacteriaceae bacterium]
MIKIKREYLFVLLIICLFFTGWVINDLKGEELKTGSELFWQLAPLSGPVLTSIALFIEIYVRQREVKKV